MNARSRILILGAGFAALAAARELRRLQPEARIMLLAPRAEFVYLPSLIWVPTGLRRPADLRLPLAPFLQRHRIEYIKGSVTGLSADARTVDSDAGEFANDALLIATGARLLRKLPGIEHALTVCEGLDAAERIRTRLEGLEQGRIAVGFGANPQEPGAVRGAGRCSSCCSASTPGCAATAAASRSACPSSTPPPPPARAAARKLAAALAGRPAGATPRPELVCIVDSLNAGSLIYRAARVRWAHGAMIAAS